MKRLLYVLLLSVLLVGCSSDSNSETRSVENDSAEIEKRDEMLPSGVLAYLEQMTGKYLSIGLFSDTKEKRQKFISEAITDVRLAMNEINDEYDENLPVVKDLLRLGEVTEDALNKLLVGDNSTEYEDSQKGGQIIGDISREYLDGELPPTIRIMTGIENAND